MEDYADISGIVTHSLLLLQKIGGAWTFWGFGIVSFLCILFVYFMVPETKDMSLEKIEFNWINGVKPRNF